jgi:surface polysaccharide O-acyltransferase-like enzyme
VERNYAIDFMKFFAILAVIVIHTSPFEQTTVFGVDGYYLDFAIDTFSRFSVPFFFISSGYLFARKLMSANTKSVYFSRYTSKLIKIFACWFAFYWLYDLLVKILFQSFNIQSKSGILSYINESINLEVFVYGSSSGYQLWYLAALVWSILILFIFMNLNRLNLLLIISLILNGIGLFGQSYSGLISLPFTTRDGLFFGLFYTTLGAVVARHHDIVQRTLGKVNPKVLVGTAVISSIFVLVERCITVFIWEGEIGDYFVFTLPVTLSLFLLTIIRPEMGKHSFITKIGQESVGIYVIHVFFIKVIQLVVDITGNNAVYETVGWHIVFTPVVFILSYITYSVLQKTKGKIACLRHSSLIGTVRKNYNCK